MILTASSGRVTRQPLDKTLNNHISKLQTLFSDKKKELEQLKEGKEKKINELLPSATSAGLSEAYKQEKESIQKSITWWNWVFVASIAVFIGVFALYFWKLFEENLTYISFLKSLPFWIFSGFFTFYATKQIAEYKSMASEYAYKERLNQTYKKYEKETKETQNEELKIKLLKIMLGAAMLNPSDKIYLRARYQIYLFLKK